MKYTIDKNIPLPLYYQLKQIIINLIDDGVYKEDETIPTEHELIDKYQLSRTTVRQALNELVTEGYLYKRKGVGTFVSSKKKINDQQEVINSTIYKLDKVINRNGFVCKTKFLNVGITEATPDIAKHLSINVGDLVWVMDRVRYAGIKVASFSRSYIDKKLLENFDKEAKEAAQHFYQYLDSKGLKVSIIRETLIPSLPDSEVRKILEVSSTNPIMLVQDTGYADDGAVIEYSISSLDVTFINMTATFKRG